MHMESGYIYLYAGFNIFGDSQHITVESTTPQYHMIRPTNIKEKEKISMNPCVGHALSLTVGKSWGSFCCRSGSPH